MRLIYSISFALRVIATYICLTTPVFADPVTGFFAAMGLGPINLLGTAAWTFGFNIGTALAGVAGTLLLNTAIAVGTHLLLQANRPPPQSATPSQRIVNIRQPVQDMRISYGLVRVGGPIGFWQAKGGKRYASYLMNAGEITSFEAYYLNETEVTLDGSGFVTESDFKVDGNSKIQIQKFLGASGQTAPTLLLNNFTEWTSDEKYTGLAGVVAAFENVDAENFAKVYESGREPTVSALIKGKKVYDPREVSHYENDTSTWAYSTNFALILADWIVSTDGFGAQVDWDDVADEADACDVSVLDRDSNPVAKYQFCGEFSLGETREQVMKKLALAGDAFVFERPDGKVGFKVGRWIEPAVTIEEKHIYSYELGEGRDGTQLVNAVAIQYTEPAAGYREHQSAAYYVDDGNAYQEEVVAVYGIPNHNQAVRIAKAIHRGLRAEYTISLNLNLYGLLLRTERFFKLELPELGISEFFEITDWSLAENGMSVNVTAQSVAQSDFSFDASTEEPEPNPIESITVSDTISDPTNVAISSPDAGALYISFDAPSRSSLLVRVRYRENGAGNWNEANVPSGQTYYTINGLPFGDDYEAQVQFRTATANTSNWVASTPTTVTISSTSSPPNPVTGVSVTGNTGNANFDWTAPNNPNYVGARIYTNTTNDFSTATLQATEYGTPNTADSANVTLAANTYYGWVVAISGSGDEATEVATGSFTVS